MIVEEDTMNCKVLYLEIATDGNLQLKRGHDFYYQMQYAMYYTDRQWCDLVVLTKSLHVERIKL